MIILLYIAIVIAYFYAIFYKTQRSMHMLQENLYNENNRYVKWVLKNLKEMIGFDILAVIIAIVGLVVGYRMELVSNLCLVIIILLLLLTGYRKHKKIAEDQNKKKLVVTKRIKRLSWNGIWIMNN